MDKRCVLIVDDERDIREILQEALEFTGHRVYTAGDGAEALRVLGEIERPSVILLDLMMPIMDGAKFHKHQKQDPRFNDIPVVIISADCHLKRKSDEMGVNGFIQKPIELSELLKVTEGFCR